MTIYANLHESYGWTRKEIDEEEFEYIVDLLVVVLKRNNTETKTEEKQMYIEQLF